MYRLTMGIEHLMTGVALRSTGDPDAPSAPAEASVFTFERESASVVAVTSDEPFEAYWPVKQCFLTAEKVPDKGEPLYSHGEAEWYAQVMGHAMRVADQAYTEKATHGPIPAVVVKAIRAKHGTTADDVLASLKWDGLNKCWYYNWAGMFVGVETDGYIHT